MTAYPQNVTGTRGGPQAPTQPDTTPKNSAHNAETTTSTRTAATTANLVQLVNQDGTRIECAGYDNWVADITDAQLGQLYEDMVAVRRLDNEATALQRQGQLGLWPPLLGQEAAQIGSAHAQRADDFVFSSYRENGVAYVRGVALGDVLKVWRGTSHSGWDPFEINMATPQIIIGAQSLHAVGYALGVQNDGADSVAFAYFGDGATSEGDVNEALVFAASFKAPVVFFCQNNQWAISEPVTLQTTEQIADRAKGFGIPSMRVDGNDVLAVLAATRIAVDRARTGEGPTFIEAVTYRMGPHTTADDPTRYRDKAELEVWAAKDPIKRLEAYLRNQGAFTPELEARVAAKADAVAAELRAGCINQSDPEPLTIFDNVYSEPHRGIAEQRDHYSRYLDLFEAGAR